MICPKCRYIIEDGSDMCRVCGADLTEENTQSVSEQEQSVQSYSDEAAEEEKHKRREVRVNAGIYKLICIAMGMCLIAGSVVWATMMLRDRIDSPVKSGVSEPESAAPAETTAATTKAVTTTTVTTTTPDPYKEAVAPQFEDDYGIMYVSSDSLVMRIGPGYDYTKVDADALTSGTPLSVLAEQEDAKSGETWCYVSYGEHEGWICKTYLSSTNPTITVVKPDDTYSNPLWYKVTRYGGLKLYSGPDESYDVIAEIPEGEEIQKIGYNYMSVKWVYTCYGDQYGWIISYDGDWFNPTIE